MNSPSPTVARSLVWRGVILAAAFACGLCLATGARAQHAPLPEFQVLDHYVGEWDVHLAVKPDDPSSPGQNLSGDVKADWILDGRFVQQFVTLKDPAGKTTPAITTLMTYDLAAKVYRTWSFTSSGSVSEGTGTWDEASRIMTTVTRDPKAGTETTVRADFSNEGVESWSFTTKNRNGQVISILKGKNTKR